ncbi:glycine betaine ABC transporter substrate-binding protein [Lactococcus lactis]
MRKLYGLDLNVKTMQNSLIYKALNSGAVNVAEVYSTDSQIKTIKLSQTNISI